MCCITQESSVAASGAIPGEVGKSGRIVGRPLVDHGQTGVDGRAVPGVDRAVDRGREHHAAALLQPDEGVGPCRVVRREARPGDGDEATAVGEAREGRADVTERGVGHAAIDMRHRRERRVHQHDARRNAGVEMIIDLRRVEPGDRDARKEMAEEPRAGFREFVEHERAAGELGENGEQAGPGRRLQHAVGRA